MFNFSYSAALLNIVQILPVWLDIPVAGTPRMARYSSQSHNPDIVSISPHSIPVNLPSRVEHSTIVK